MPSRGATTPPHAGDHHHRLPGGGEQHQDGADDHGDDDGVLGYQVHGRHHLHLGWGSFWTASQSEDRESSQVQPPRHLPMFYLVVPQARPDEVGQTSDELRQAGAQVHEG